ncbi:MAG: 2-amino-4-hydroxy-6-hydroxymethyldihydropteridine diphosphokinase [Gammaproteobacteria bacterium]|nr:2-amino-4-hydroxy-6-hydroxymethyldihydropteridine diphosphokinase [Gammaproteobacteria bacterium]
MARIFIGVGSNSDREKHIRSGVRALGEAFHNLRISTIYENEAVGFSGDNFYNFVVGCDAGLEVEEVVSRLHRIEDEHGRDRSQPRFSSRTLDLDLLLYDDLVIDTGSLHLPRPDINEYAYVLCPLAEIAPELRHPVSRKTYATLWSEFDRAGQDLRPVELNVELGIKI